MSAPNLTPEQIAKLKSKVSWRILPYVFLLYIIAFLDRANVGYVKLAMQEDLGWGPEIMGFGIGIFFIGYVLLEIPAAIAVERSSARRLFSRILISWGICTSVIGLVYTPFQFYASRFLLGVAEAGFFPGIIVYFGHWFPRKDRGKAFAWLVTAIPIAQVIGARLSGWIQENVHWFDMPGWRWVLILEGLPAVIMGFVTIYYFTDHPRHAKWLSDQEREWLETTLAAEKAEFASTEKISIWKAMGNKNVLILAAALLAANAGSYVFGGWLPEIIKNAGKMDGMTITNAEASNWAMWPYLGSLIAVLLAGFLSDKSGKRRFVTFVGMFSSGIFLQLTAIPNQPFWLVMVWLFFTASAIYAWPSSFWVLPSLALTSSAAAAAIGFINSVGNLGGAFGPSWVGVLQKWKWEQWQYLTFISGCYIAASFLILLVQVRENPGSNANTNTHK